ncbi:MAG: hypothetical protein Q4B96_04370 [Bacillota bacterium]|nr:hypothetical protein [Bacillota bacterium]
MQDHVWDCFPLPLYCAGDQGGDIYADKSEQQLPAYVCRPPRRRQRCRPAPPCPAPEESGCRACVDFAPPPFECRARLCARVTLPAGICVRRLCVDIDSAEQQYCGCRCYLKVCFTVTVRYQDRCGNSCQCVGHAVNCFAIGCATSDEMNVELCGKPSLCCNNGVLSVGADIKISG